MQPYSNKICFLFPCFFYFSSDFHQINLPNIQKMFLFSISNLLLACLWQLYHKGGVGVYKVFNSNYLTLFYSIYLCFIPDVGWGSKSRSWIPNLGVLCSKPLGGSEVDSAFHPSEVVKMSTRNFWELSGKK